MSDLSRVPGSVMPGRVSAAFAIVGRALFHSACEKARSAACDAGGLEQSLDAGAWAHLPAFPVDVPQPGANNS